MALNMRQELRMSQQLVMTPQLQQAIKLLQLSRMELQDLVRGELLENPLLDESQEMGTTTEEPVSSVEMQDSLEMNRAETPDTICKDLVDAANAAGGDDNITVVVIEVKEEANTPSPAALASDGS